MTSELILSVTANSGSIEDIFDPCDFREYVLGDKAKNYAGSNSAYVKKNLLDKVLLAKKFLEAVESSPSLRPGRRTLDNLQELFRNIEDKF